MRKTERSLHSPLMWAFRATSDPEYRVEQAKSARDANEMRLRGSKRLASSYGVEEASLVKEVHRDVELLLNTVNLNSTVDLSGFPEVRTSILNYGIADLSIHEFDARGINLIIADVREAILNFEPRIFPPTLKIEPDEHETGNIQSVRLRVSAEIRQDPLRITSEFLAELDPSLGRITLSGAS